MSEITIKNLDKYPICDGDETEGCNVELIGVYANIGDVERRPVVTSPSLASYSDSSDDIDMASFRIEDDIDPDAILIARHPISDDVISQKVARQVTFIDNEEDNRSESVCSLRNYEFHSEQPPILTEPYPSHAPPMYQESENEYDHVINVVPPETIYYPEDSNSSFYDEKPLTPASFMKKKDVGICRRCYKKVYPAERVGIEVDIMLHKNCFKCGHCGVTLSLNTFVLASTGNGNKNVFCKGHAPKADRHTIDPDSFEIRSAVKAQRINKQDSVNGQVRLRDTIGWQYDPRAKEFQHIKHLQQQNKKLRPHNYDVAPDKMEYESGDVIRQLREGVLKRNTVKDLAASITNMRMHGHRSDSQTDSDTSLENVTYDQNSYDCQDHYDDEETIDDVTYASSRDGSYAPILSPVENPKENDWCQVERDEKQNEAKLEPLKVVTEGSVLRLKESFQNEAQFKMQHELEMKQREEQQEMFARIDQSRLAETAKRTLPRVDTPPAKKEEDIGTVPDYVPPPEVNIAPPPHVNHHASRPLPPIPKSANTPPPEQRPVVMETVKDEEREKFQEMTDRQTNDMLLLTCNKPLHELPQPRPPKGKKHEILSEDLITRIDIRVMQIASYEPHSFTELVYQLTDNCTTDLEKIRAIFRWITLRDLNQVCFERELNPDSPYFFLKGIKYGLESYHELFRRLCSYAGIPVQIIRGLSKSAGYLPGTKPSNERFRNIWTAAYIDENWRFIDCHWGARHVDKSRVTTTDGVFCYSLDEFFFLTDPEDLIYMHFPDDPKWQLLEKPVDLDKFLSMPVVKSTFFHYKLKFIRDCQATLHTDNGLVDVLLRKYSNLDLVFNTRLEAGGERFIGHCIYQNAEAGVVFHVNLPYAGEYIFTVFACERGTSDVFSNVCSFKLVSDCDVMERNIPSRFPMLPDGYGLLQSATDFGIETESHKGFYLVTDKEKMILNIKFGCSLNISQKYCKGGELGENSDIELSRHCFQRYRDHKHVSYLLRFPASGFYVFSLFAAKRGTGSQLLECACRYIIHCTSQLHDHVIKIYPRVLQQWIRCRLYEPTHGDLRVNKNVKFKLEAHNATAVAVIVHHQWFYLKQGETAEEKAKHIWIGVAHTGNSIRHKLEVYARFKGNNKDFFPLLEYNLIEEL